MDSRTAAEPVMTLSGVTAVGEKGTVIEDFSLTLKKGEICALIGTEARELLNYVDLFSGNLRQISGSAELEGTSFHLDHLHHEIEIIHQGIHVYPMMTAWEQIMLDQTRPFFVNAKKQIAICHTAADRFGISIGLTQPAHQLSDEDRKLLAFLRAYINCSKVLVIHEPFHDVNKRGRNYIRKMISAMKENGQAILLLTSYLEDALMVSDTISVVSRGRVILTEDAAKVAHDPRGVMYELSGWQSLENDRKSRDNEVLQTIIDASDIISSSSELNQVLQYLAKDINKVLNADRTVIYIIDKTTRAIMDIISDDEMGLEGWDFSASCLDSLSRIDTVLDLERADTGRHPLFLADPHARSISVMPIRRDQNIEGGILVFYHYPHGMKDVDEKYLLTFSKEISIAIETSRLLGRSMLLQESHHRIKNNLQMIMSMIYMQKAQYQLQGGNVDDILDSIISKISSISIVHSMMAKDESAGSIINLKKIVQEVVGLNEQAGIRIETEVEDISIPYNKATLISLMVNELICNSVKYAFEGAGDHVIRIRCTNDGTRIHICVCDNGKGFPANRIESSGGLGWSIVDNIVKSMNGAMQIDGSDGCTINMVLPLSHVYDASNSAKSQKAS